MGGSLVYSKVIARHEPQPIVWRDLTARLGPVRWPRFTITIIRKRAKLAKILRIVAAPGTRPPLPPPIDYAHREAIVYAVGPRSSTGYDLRVVRVTDDGDQISFVVREITPSLTEHVTAKLTYPYRLVTIPRTSKHIRFVLLGRP